jgi:hypothetical protein
LLSWVLRANADAPLTGSESAARLVGTATAGGVAGGSTDASTATIEAALASALIWHKK